MRVGGCRWSCWPTCLSFSLSLSIIMHAVPINEMTYIFDRSIQIHEYSRLWEQSERGWQINNIKAHLTICCSWSPTCSLSLWMDLCFCRQNDHVHIIYTFQWNEIHRHVSSAIQCNACPLDRRICLLLGVGSDLSPRRWSLIPSAACNEIYLLHFTFAHDGEIAPQPNWTDLRPWGGHDLLLITRIQLI